MLYRQIAAISFFLIIASPALMAEQISAHYRAEIAYSSANPDYSPFDDGEGVSYFADIWVNDAWFAYARYTDVTFTPSGGLFRGNVTQWFEAGAGYRQKLWKWFSGELAASYQQVELNEEKEGGHGLHIGISARPIDPLLIRFQAAAIDLVIDDWHMLFEVQYHFTQRFFLTARLRDYADWDFTYYEFGAGVRF